MSGTLAPCPWTVLDDDGIIVPGAKIHTYLAGSSTPVFVYTDSDLAVAHPNPVVADSAGRAIMYLDALSYRFVVCDADDVPLYTVDPIQGVQSTTTNLGEQFSFGGDSTSPITATSYPSGTSFDKCHAGTALLSLDSGILAAGTYKLEGMILGVGATVTAALVNLSDGSPDTALVTISSASTTGARVISAAITFAAAGAAKSYAIKVKVDAGSGFVWGLKLTRTA